MKVILFVVSTLERTGPISQLLSIVKYLDRNVFEPHIVTLSPEPVNSRISDFRELDVSLHCINYSRIKGFLLLKRKINDIVDKVKPALIHSQGFRPDLYCSMTSGKIPKICTVRNIPQIDYRMKYGIVSGFFMSHYHVVALRNFSKIVGVSNAVSSNLKLKYHLNNVDTILNGVDTKMFSPISDENKKKIRTKLKLPINSNIWVTTGDINSRKNTQLLIKVWRKLFLTIDNMLLIVGDGEFMHECKNLANGASNILLTGRTGDVVDYLRLSNVYVSASKAEGLPNSVLEGMACGLPFVLSNILPHKEILNCEKEAGYLFDINDEERAMQVFSEMATVLKNSAEYIKKSKSAIYIAHEILSAQKMSMKYQDIYSSLIGRAN